MGPVYWTSLSTDLSEWELDPSHTEWPPICTKAASTCTEFRSRSAQGPRHPNICLYLSLPAGCILVAVSERASRGTQVAGGNFSVSHQVGTSDIGSNLVSVLGLRLSAKSLGIPIRAASYGALTKLCVGVGSHGVVRVSPA